MVWDGAWEESRLEDQTLKSKVPAGLVRERSLLSLEQEKEIDQLAGKIVCFSFPFFFLPLFF